ncbi:phosphate/phosphite/phosphonate ABC transporter substrate-binding protein [Undibacterium sp. SXout11W]|uniref:phosphate/phosphite/phosphonate ABC transporter substrate-binding protein n=1 Tax=Undibacterium sp. SXout11W TaxID=3413050 RepID=UPI003BEFFC5B
MKDRRKFILNSLYVASGMILNSVGKNTWAQDKIVRFGITSQRPATITKERWSEIGSYLGTSMNCKVEIVPIPIAHVYQHIAENSVDFVLANPNETMLLKYKQHAKILASLNGQHGPLFGGVIVVRKGGEIKKVEDLNQKAVVALGQQSAGGYLFQVHLMAEKGLYPHRQYGVVMAETQDEALTILKTGKVSAAFIRTGILESMAKEGKIQPDQYVVLAERKDTTFQLQHSTELYPEHYVLALPHVSKELEANFKTALLKLTPADAATQKANIKGFIEPLSIASLENVMKPLQVAPFDQKNQASSKQTASGILLD